MGTDHGSNNNHYFGSFRPFRPNFRFSGRGHASTGETFFSAFFGTGTIIGVTMNLDATKVLIGKSSSKKDANTEKQLRPGGWVFREIDMTVFHVTDPKELQDSPTTLVLHGTRIIADHCILTLIIINDILDEIYK